MPIAIMSHSSNDTTTESYEEIMALASANLGTESDKAVIGSQEAVQLLKSVTSLIQARDYELALQQINVYLSLPLLQDSDKEKALEFKVYLNSKCSNSRTTEDEVGLQIESKPHSQYGAEILERIAEERWQHAIDAFAVGDDVRCLNLVDQFLTTSTAPELLSTLRSLVEQRIQDTAPLVREIKRLGIENNDVIPLLEEFLTLSPNHVEIKRRLDSHRARQTGDFQYSLNKGKDVIRLSFRLKREDIKPFYANVSSKRLFMTPAIPKNAIRKAIAGYMTNTIITRHLKTMRQQAVSAADILLLYNGSAFGSGGSGMSLTDRSVYWSNKNTPMSISFADIYKVRVDRSRRRPALVLNSNRILRFRYDTDSCCDVVYQILTFILSKR